MHALGIILTPAAQAVADWIMVGILALCCIALIVALIALIKVAFYE